MNVNEYWDKQWEKRLTPGYSPAMNRDKMAKLVHELAIRDGLDDMEKLDIGCGSGIHPMILSGFHQSWKNKWTGIDLSDAVRFCKKYGFNAIQGDFFSYPFDKKFGAFLLLDSFEHIMDRKGLAKRILELVDEKYYVFINVPLYCQAHSLEDGAETPVSPHDVKNFFLDLKVNEDNFRWEVYGSYGYPYMIAEGGNF